MSAEKARDFIDNKILKTPEIIEDLKKVDTKDEIIKQIIALAEKDGITLTQADVEGSGDLAIKELNILPPTHEKLIEDFKTTETSKIVATAVW